MSAPGAELARAVRVDRETGATAATSASCGSRSATRDSGFPEEIRDRIFDPFFTTRPERLGDRARERAQDRARARRIAVAGIVRSRQRVSRPPLPLPADA